MPVKSFPAAVRFHFLEQSLHPKERRRLKSFLLSIFKQERTAVQSLDYIFCSDTYLLEINQQFLQHNFFTDIISFNLAAENTPVAGEIYISLERVRENAEDLEQAFSTELHRVIFHGVLHLCGYKDKSTADTKKMRAKELYYLKRYFKKIP